MWLDIKLFVPPDRGNRRYDLLVRRGAFNPVVVRVPGCFWHQTTGTWGNPYRVKNVPALRKGDVPIYFMAEPDFPHELDHDRRK